MSPKKKSKTTAGRSELAVRLAALRNQREQSAIAERQHQSWRLRRDFLLGRAFTGAADTDEWLWRRIRADGAGWDHEYLGEMRDASWVQPDHPQFERANALVSAGIAGYWLEAEWLQRRLGAAEPWHAVTPDSVGLAVQPEAVMFGFDMDVLLEIGRTTFERLGSTHMDIERVPSVLEGGLDARALVDLFSELRAGDPEFAQNLWLYMAGAFRIASSTTVRAEVPTLAQRPGGSAQDDVGGAAQATGKSFRPANIEEVRDPELARALALFPQSPSSRTKASTLREAARLIPILREFGQSLATARELADRYAETHPSSRANEGLVDEPRIKRALMPLLVAHGYALSLPGLGYKSAE